MEECDKETGEQIDRLMDSLNKIKLSADETNKAMKVLSKNVGSDKNKVHPFQKYINKRRK